MASFSFLDSARRQFLYYKSLGDKSMAQLDDAGLLWKPNAESNSIATIVKHMWGNMLSRWTNFLTEDGEKPWRDREGEFVADDVSRAQLLEWWEAGWNCLFTALDSITDDDLERIIYIRNEGHTVLEAINRQLAHYPYHVGQIVYLAKAYQAANWSYLSIPPKGSETYNAEKFSQEKTKRHFTEEWLKGK